MGKNALYLSTNLLLTLRMGRCFSSNSCNWGCNRLSSMLITGLVDEPFLLSIRLTIRLNLPQHEQKVRVLNFLRHKTNNCSKFPFRQSDQVVLTISTTVVKHRVITPSLMSSSNLSQCIVIWNPNQDPFGHSPCPSREKTKILNHSKREQCIKVEQKTKRLQIGQHTEWVRHHWLL